ncbi:MAG: deoxyguanosinetriphosphate triphosphohydrolase [Kiritimatiellae bacterium]|nr:deoxyguanosinetriphosphate triphosphohydrolase [Kiritimatiellia bacterium]MCO5060855.1 deoxyguanosinetriphosphate triphosphohydrolase [Kiritimatiellia bacterium]MCO5069393.1 deoxyguanosinetriphosphate triphosphohydrolase [Kiritimatiellia bacterium]
MLRTRKETEALEDQTLAPYAAHSALTRGRRHPEPAHEHRAEFQRDRDRVLHSRCFRRLEYKTQVFVNGTADHYRTRLTHTLEMTAVGRTLARALGANQDLAETIALAHDIGHSPFGHAGEEALNELMADHGGFDHNLQSVRWVEELEVSYPDHPGLNLTWEVRAGLYKHQAAIPNFLVDGHPIGPHQYIEAQIADVADDMTYSAHDVDDGLEAGILTEAQLLKTEAWKRAAARVKQHYGDLPEAQRLAAGIRALLDMQVEDVLLHSERQLARYTPQSPEDVMRCPERVLSYGPEMQAIMRKFRTFLFENMYWSPTVEKANTEATAMMRKLFLHYIAHPDVMGRKARARIEKDGLWRAACDYLSGMTDRYALDEFHKFGLVVGP